MDERKEWNCGVYLCVCVGGGGGGVCGGGGGGGGGGEVGLKKVHPVDYRL